MMVKAKRVNRSGRTVKQGRHDETSDEGNASDVEVRKSRENMDKGSCEEKGVNKKLRARKEGKRTGSEEDVDNDSDVGKNEQLEFDSGQSKRANRSRRMKPKISDSEKLTPDEEHSGEVSGETEQTTDTEQRGQKARRRAATVRKESRTRASVATPSRLTRSAKATVRSAQPRSRKTRRVSRKKEESAEEEDSNEETSEPGSSDDANSGSSEDSDRAVHARSSSRTKLSKRKLDEVDHHLRKKARKPGRGSGDRDPHDDSKSSLKAQKESDEDFVLESSGRSSSCSDDDKAIIDDESDGVSADGSSEEDVKKISSMNQKGSRNTKEETPEEKDEDSTSSEEEVCSVCKFAGAADLMLLCDGENCEEACHSFCLKYPLQCIPEGDWFCPLCVHEKNANDMGGVPMKRTSKLRAKIMPPQMRIEAIIGFRDDPSGSEGGEEKERNSKYLLKWCSLSHRHDTWVPEDWVAFAHKSLLANYQRKSSYADGDEMSDERRPEWTQIDRVIACRDQESHSMISPSAQGAVEAQRSSSRKREYLVKWTNIEYSGSTWEEENSDEDMQEAIVKFFERYELAEKNASAELSDRLVASTITKQPTYISGGVMYDYQLQGFQWLLSNFQQRRNVILADEMGLGKTIQAVSLIMAIKHEHLSNKPVLVIGPKSTLVGWEQEFRRWGADLNSVFYQGDKESRILIRNHEFYAEEKIPLFDALVTSYDLAMLDNSTLQKFKWSCIIVDEGHRMKNMRSKLGILLKRQTSDFRVLLTGTPVQNTLTELFALLNFLDPTEFPDPERSAQEFAQVDAQGAGSRSEAGIEQQVSRLHELLTPRMLRRLKADVMQGKIPGKKHVEVMCALTPSQRRLYKLILKKKYKDLLRGSTTGKKRSLTNILVNLKLVCNHPYLFEPVIDHGDPEESFRLLVAASGKFQLLEKLLPKLKEGGHRVLLFSQMTKMLDILEEFLSHLDYKYCRIDGSTVAAERQREIAEYNSSNSDLFIFLISTRAGGLGINLPSADTVIIYDPDFNPFVDLQAQARAHRIGQENVVLVYQLITKFSVEEKIMERARQKLAMENLVMRRDDKETAADVNAVLLHGARRILEEHDVEASSVKWTDEDIELLLNRDISDTKDAKDGGGGYLGAIQGGVLGGGPVDESPPKTGREWEDLFGKLEEHDEEAAQVNLGRGKRQRRNIQYAFEPNIDAQDDDDEEAPDADDPSASGESSASSSASDSDDSLEEELGVKKRGPYLKKSRSMNESEQDVISQPSSQAPDQDLPPQLPSSLTPSLGHLLTHPVSYSNKVPPRSKILPPSPSSPLYANMQTSPRQPAYNSTHDISAWPTSYRPPSTTTVANPSPGASHSQYIAPSSYRIPSAGPSWDHKAPRGISASASQTYQSPSISGSIEPPNPGQTHITQVSYSSAASRVFESASSQRAVTAAVLESRDNHSPKFSPKPLGVLSGSLLGQPEAHLSSSSPHAYGRSVNQFPPSEPGLPRSTPMLASHWSQASPTPIDSQDDKGLSLQDFLQQARTSLVTQAAVAPQVFREPKRALGDVLQLSSATHIRRDDVYKRTETLIQDSTNMSLGQAVRPPGSKKAGPTR